jgi:hypothetical protein
MTGVENWLKSIEQNKWFSITLEQAEALKPFARIYDLTFSKDFKLVRKEPDDSYFKPTDQKK